MLVQELNRDWILGPAPEFTAGSLLGAAWQPWDIIDAKDLGGKMLFLQCSS